MLQQHIYGEQYMCFFNQLRTCEKLKNEWSYQTSAGHLSLHAPKKHLDMFKHSNFIHCKKSRENVEKKQVRLSVLSFLCSHIVTSFLVFGLCLENNLHTKGLKEQYSLWQKCSIFEYVYYYTPNTVHTVHIVCKVTFQWGCPWKNLSSNTVKTKNIQKKCLLSL